MTDPSLITHAEPAMGTVFSLAVVPGDVSPAPLRSALSRVCAELHRLDAIFSTWDRQSPVSLLRRGEALLGDLPSEVGEVLELCRQAREVSGGWFDPWAMPGGVDPTGMVKGWAVERALDVLRDAGVAAAMVNGGGDLATFGAPSPGEQWRIGIRHPWRADALAGIVEVDGALATSGCYERGQHLIDPATRAPVARAASATVAGPSLAMADALATALAVGGKGALDAVAAAPGYHGCLICPDGSVLQTGGLRFVS